MAAILGRRQGRFGAQPMKQSIFSDLKPQAEPAEVYAKTAPKVSRREPAKVLTAAERAAILASRPDLASKK